MKPRFYVLLSIVFLLIANTSSFAQDDAYGNDDDFESQTKESKKSGKKINSGYVFIDGKYIEPPYRFKVKNGNLFVNNKQACTEKSYNTIELKKKDIYRAGYPPCISEESDWTERNNCKIGNTNVTYNEMMKQYYLKNYKVEGAYDSLINYYRNYPNVISFEEFEELNGGVYKIICYNGNEILFQLDREKFIKRHSDENVDKNKNVDKTIKMYIEIFQDNLREECAIFFQSNRSLKEKSLITENELFAICSQDTLSNAIPEDVITSFTRNKVSVIKSVLEEYEGNDSFKKRLLKQQRTTVENSEEDVNDNRKKTFDLNNYSPQNNRFVAFFPIDYESGVSDMEEEIFSVKSKIENQGYSFIFTNYLFDQTANDDDLAYMPYSQLTELCADAGFLYVGSHGNINTLLIARALTPQGLEYWCNNDEDVYIVATDEDDYPDEWDHSNSLFAAIVSSNWINKYWKEDLENNNTISIISACKAHSGICEACAGGICFGYDEDTYLNDCLTNNANLLSLMNGQRKKSTYRNAIDAYDNIILYSGFNYIANSNITLCPATKDYFPANNALVPPGVTYGFFETDTWCDATIPANEALTFSVTGDINVNNVYWENNTNGKANKIAYEWSGTQGSVSVHVHTDKIVAYGGGGQKLDFDRKTPNGEANAYYIFRVGYGTNEVVDFNVNDYSIFANTTVDFTNTSTIENPLSYHWDFGDGYQSSEQNPSHTYTEPGVYDVSLFINTPVGMQYETKLAYISVYGSDIGSMSCSAEVNNDRTITVYADISSSYANLISEYRFAIDFGNGDIEIVEGISNSVQVTYTYNDYGIYSPEVFADVFFSSGGETFSTGCVCNSVELYNPFPCNTLEANFSISPTTAYLTGPYSNSTATVYFDDLTIGGTNYTWDWYFLAEPENGYVPSGGISHECYVESWGESGNPQSKIYNHEGLYPVLLHVTDGIGCTNDITHYVNIAQPSQCINNLKILSSGSDQLWSSNRLIIPWQQDNEECTLSLSNIFDFVNYCSGCNCGLCGDAEQCYRWYINGEESQGQILDGYYVENGHTDETNINIESFDWLLPYKNQSLVLYGRIINTTSTSINCYDSTNIEVLAVNCVGTMNSNQFIYAYLASNNVFLPHFTANGYMLNKNSWKEFYSGQMNLNSGVNQFVDSNDISLLACDGIILSDGFKTGSGKFIAGSASDGAILEGCYQNSNFYYVANDIPPTEINLDPELNITPNPVSELFTIIVTHNVNDFLRLEIFDSNSRLIKTVYNDYAELGVYEFQVSEFNFNPGMYFCRYSNSQQTLSEKFIRIQDNDK